MNVSQIHRAALDVKQALNAMGYTSADCRISFNMAGSPICIVAEASPRLSHMVLAKTATDLALHEALADIESWIHALPNAKERAKEDFLKMIQDLPSQAAELGIELPVKLAS